MWNIFFYIMFVVFGIALFFGLAWHYKWRKACEEAKTKKIDLAVSTGIFILFLLFILSSVMSMQETGVAMVGSLCLPAPMFRCVHCAEFQFLRGVNGQASGMRLEVRGGALVDMLGA